MSTQFTRSLFTRSPQRSLKSYLLLLSTLTASSVLISNGALAETQASQSSTSPTSTADLIKAVSNDPMNMTPAKEQPSLTGESAVIQQINQQTSREQITRPVNKTAQGGSVTSVSQLSDVKPTDWAFTALQSLVERYGCIAGYPDRTFRGRQATSRYEFAAGLNACLDKINEIISAGLADKVSKEDLATLQKLQEEFAAELATLRGRVEALDAKVTKLEAQQFSTTTKLFGQAIFGLQGRLGNSAQIGGLTVRDPATNVTFGQQVQLS
ncbi:MAG: iron uptake porin, partial [Pseudanabaena sp.]